MSKDSIPVLALPEIIDLDTLDDIRDRMLDAVENGSLAVDASSVERVATNVVIMLLSAAETARRNAFSFTLTNQSEAMQSAIARLGLTDSFTSLAEGN